MEKSECGLERNSKFQKKNKIKKLGKPEKLRAVNQQELMIFTQGYRRK